ncbi:MAG: toprim domain-containing protein [Candidatus Paceibacterota bacterium]
MDPLTRLAEIFSHFPGIGPRQAKRFVYYILNRPNSDIKEFTKLIEEVKKLSLECSKCHRLYLLTSYLLAPSSALCSICSDPSRDQATLMVVARDSDFETIEKSGAYRGLYFILGGSVPVLDKEPEKRIRLKKLLEHVSGLADSNSALKEIILSLNTTPDGEHTTEIVREALGQIIKDKHIKISILGRGLSTGAELEYADGETIRNALRNRG